MSRAENQPSGLNNLDDMMKDQSKPANSEYSRARKLERSGRRWKKVIGILATFTLCTTGAGVVKSLYEDATAAYENSQLTLEEVETKVEKAEITKMFIDPKLCIGGYDMDVVATSQISIEKYPIPAQKYTTRYTDTLEKVICASNEESERSVLNSAPLMSERDKDDSAAMSEPTVVTLKIPATAFEGITYPAELINQSKFVDNANMTAAFQKTFDTWARTFDNTFGEVPNYTPTGTDVITNINHGLSVASSIEYMDQNCDAAAMNGGLYDAAIEALKHEEMNTYNQSHDRKITSDDVTIEVVDESGNPVKLLKIKSQYDQSNIKKQVVDKLTQLSGGKVSVSLTLASDKSGQPQCEVKTGEIERPDMEKKG